MIRYLSFLYPLPSSDSDILTLSLTYLYKFVSLKLQNNSQVKYLQENEQQYGKSGRYLNRLTAEVRNFSNNF
jgi:hypothetical protein